MGILDNFELKYELLLLLAGRNKRLLVVAFLGGTAADGFLTGPVFAAAPAVPISSPLRAPIGSYSFI